MANELELEPGDVLVYEDGVGLTHELEVETVAPEERGALYRVQDRDSARRSMLTEETVAAALEGGDMELRPASEDAYTERPEPEAGEGGDGA